MGVGNSIVEPVLQSTEQDVVTQEGLNQATLELVRDGVEHFNKGKSAGGESENSRSTVTGVTNKTQKQKATQRQTLSGVTFYP